jgi:GNAT superfamily N-acetyltransferase
MLNHNMVLISFTTTGNIMQAIVYEQDRRITPEQLADVFIRSGIQRPVDDLARIAKMLQHGNLLITAWDGESLVGVARALTDFAFCCYLSDLAVDRVYQHQGIGQALIGQLRGAIGRDSMLLLLAAPSAMAYYPKVGFEAVGNGWIIQRPSAV